MTNCRVLHPELFPIVINEQGEINDKKREKYILPPLKVLTSGKVDGYPNSIWTEVKGNRLKMNKEAKVKEVVGNEVANVEHQSSILVNTNNKFAILEEGEV